MQEDVIRRLLMYGFENDAQGVRVPRGDIQGVGFDFIGNPVNPTPVLVKGRRIVGLEGMTHPPLNSIGKP